MIAESLPADLAAAHAMILAERAARTAAEFELVDARAEASGVKADLTSTEALIAHLKLAIEKLRRALYGSQSERQARLLDQMELELEELEAAASEDEAAAQVADAQASRTVSFRRRPSRRSFPEHLPRERVVIAAPSACPCCGSAKLSKLGEEVTETLEVIPRRWKVAQTVRERFSCRACETITQPSAPFHVTPRGFAVEPAERALRPRRHQPQRLDARRPGRCCHDGVATHFTPSSRCTSRGPSGCTAMTRRCRS